MAYTADIGFGIETFETLADVQRAVRTRISAIESSTEFYRRARSMHGPKIRDAAGKVVATVSYNARLWSVTGNRDEIVLEVAP